MPQTYEPIATQTLGSAAGSIAFASIPSTYTDLELVMQTRSTFANASDILYVVVNIDSGSNYSYTRLTGDGSTAASARESNLPGYWRLGYSTPAANATSGVFGVDKLHIMNYSNTSTFKTALWRNSPATIQAAAAACLWRSTAAINRIDVYCGNGNLVAGSTFTLYGMKAA